MTASVAYDPRQLTGYRLEQLAAAFDRIRNPRDWKAPIRATIHASDRPLMEMAVLWFTDSVPEFVPIPGSDDRLTIRALGYRLAGTANREGHLRGAGALPVSRIPQDSALANPGPFHSASPSEPSCVLLSSPVS